jgi:hypothetical protein
MPINEYDVGRMCLHHMQHIGFIANEVVDAEVLAFSQHRDQTFAKKFVVRYNRQGDRLVHVVLSG